MIDNFTGEYSFLSNFHIVDVEYNGVIYKSSEHAYQAAKATNKQDHSLIMNCNTPGKAKILGSKIKLDNKEWDKQKFFIMYHIIKNKFSQNKDLMKKLLDTKDKMLIEGNTWGDTYWGVYKGIGNNYLGKILMQVRSGINTF